MNQTTFFHSYVPIPMTVHLPINIDPNNEAMVNLRRVIEQYASISYTSGTFTGFILGFVVGVLCIAMNMQGYSK